MRRRLFIATSIGAALSACSPIGTALNDNAGFHKVLDAADGWDEALIGTRGMAQVYPASSISKSFPIDSLPTPTSASYTHLRASQFRGFQLVVDGAVERTRTFSLAQLHDMSQSSQITRHDCVEGWSAIAQWGGVRLRDVLATAKPRKDARYVVFHCMDQDDQGVKYYESLDMHEANHPQALLAMRMNGATLAPDHGGPVRVKIPTQLGYKSAKWVGRIELVGSFANIASGNGGYWEDQGYAWYAGV